MVPESPTGGKKREKIISLVFLFAKKIQAFHDARRQRLTHESDDSPRVGGLWRGDAGAGAQDGGALLPAGCGEGTSILSIDRVCCFLLETSVFVHFFRAQYCTTYQPPAELHSIYGDKLELFLDGADLHDDSRFFIQVRPLPSTRGTMCFARVMYVRTVVLFN